MELEKVRPRDLWYVVGLIATDGWLSGDGRHVTITSADFQYLETIRHILGLKIVIGKKWNGSRTALSYQLQIGSRQFVLFLTALGLTPRKSLTLGPLHVPTDAFPDFLRGVIDGDGSIRTWIHPQNGIRQWSLKISTASPVFAAWLRVRIEEHFHMKIILRECYDTGSVALHRKSELALECLRSVDKHRWYRDVIPGPE